MKPTLIVICSLACLALTLARPEEDLPLSEVSLPPPEVKGEIQNVPQTQMERRMFGKGGDHGGGLFGKFGKGKGKKGGHQGGGGWGQDFLQPFTFSAHAQYNPYFPVGWGQQPIQYGHGGSYGGGWGNSYGGGYSAGGVGGY